MSTATTPERVRRKLAYTAVGIFLLAAGITVLFLGMRSVLDVGGFCADGGAYVVRQECPDGTGLMTVGVFAGLLGFGFALAGGMAGGPRLGVLAWPALFCALGWNFLEYGIDPPPPATGVAIGWLICAIVFLVMGGVPLAFILRDPRTTLWGRDPADESARPFPGVRLVATRAARGDRTVAPGAPSAPRGTTSTDLVADLERLADLHRAGALDDAAFDRAKAARLAESEEGP